MHRRPESPRPLYLAALGGIAAVLAVAHLGPAAAATANVAIGDNTFTPPSVTIAPGDNIVWTDNGARTHTVTADDGSFDSGNLSAGQTFSRTFATPGTIRYYCKIHGGPGGVGMSGTIIVQAAQVTTTSTTAAPTTTTAAPTTTTAAATTTTVATTTTTAAAQVLAAEETRAAATSTQAAASTAQPAALASTGSGPYTAALAAIGLALVLTGVVVVRQTRLRAAGHDPEPPSP